MSEDHEAHWDMALDWCDAWNRRDLEAIMAHYADDIALCSPKVIARLGAADGWVRGKEAVRNYFAAGLAQPGLRFELVDVLAGAGHAALLYRRETGELVTDMAEFDADGRCRRVIACYARPVR